MPQRVHNITMSAEHDALIAARIEEARAAGYQSSYSGELARCVEEAQKNNRRLRHRLRGPLDGIRSQVHLLRQCARCGPIEQASLARIFRLTDQMREAIGCEAGKVGSGE